VVTRRSSVITSVAPLLRSPPKAAAASSVPPANLRQAFYANDAAIASESPGAVKLVVDAEAFKEDQSAVALTLDH
jgi:hypothetical protein